jgi:hypothetical protein
MNNIDAILKLEELLFITTMIDFDKFAREGKSYDEILREVVKRLNGNSAVVGFLFILLFVNFLVDVFQW